MKISYEDIIFMKYALKEAHNALQYNEVPIGAIITYKNKIISNAYNLSYTLLDITAHAEMQVIQQAAVYLKSKYLHECTLYVTLEPCIMCAGALFWSQITKVVFGAYAKKKERSFLLSQVTLHPKTILSTGILKNTCAILIKNFFQKKRFLQCKKYLLDI